MNKNKIYDTTWRKLRKIQLKKEPFCRFCFKMGRLTPATVADHIVPIREDAGRRLDPDNLQSLCAQCHDSLKQRMESESFSPVGTNGFPISKNHPWNKDK
jgi:5-methylcytosine-specific restriction endonuclease McrA